MSETLGVLAVLVSLFVFSLLGLGMTLQAGEMTRAFWKRGDHGLAIVGVGLVIAFIAMFFAASISFFVLLVDIISHAL
jgi:hypothetical protein